MNSNGHYRYNGRLSNNNIKHLHAVAEYMYEKAPELGLYSDIAYFIGLNHDIDKIYNDSEVGLTKEVKEYKLLGKDGSCVSLLWMPEPIRKAINNKSVELSRLKSDFDTLYVPLLIEAELHTSKDGKTVTYEQKLSELKMNKKDEQYKVATSNIEWLKAHGRI